MNENEAVKLMLAKAGDEAAVTFLIEKYQYLVMNAAFKYYLKDAEQQDLIQEGLIGLYEAIKSYDINKNDSFPAYAKLVINRKLISAVNAHNAEKNRIVSERVYVENMEDVIHETAADAGERIERKEFDKEYLARLKTVLSDMEYEIILLYMNDYSYAEIAEKTGKTKKTVDNAVSRAKKKIREAGII